MLRSVGSQTLDVGIWALWCSMSAVFDQVLVAHEIDCAAHRLFQFLIARVDEWSSVAHQMHVNNVNQLRESSYSLHF